MVISFILAKFIYVHKWVYSKLNKYQRQNKEISVKNKIKSTFDKLVKNGQLEKGLHKANKMYKKKSGKDYSKYIDKGMDKLKK